MNDLQGLLGGVPDGVFWKGSVEGKEYVGIKVATSLIVQLKTDWEHQVKSGNVFSWDGSGVKVIHEEDAPLMNATKNVFRSIIKSKIMLPETIFPQDIKSWAVLMFNQFCSSVDIFQPGISVDRTSSSDGPSHGKIDGVGLKTEISDFLKKYNVTKKYDKLFLSSIDHIVRAKKQLIKQGNPVVTSLSNPSRAEPSLAFAEMTRRIPSKKFKEIQKNLDRQPRISRSFLEEVKGGNLKKLVETKDYSSEALKALRAGLISKETFSTIQMYRTTIEYAGLENVQTIPLFRHGKVNPKARKLINETLVYRKSFNYTEGNLFPRENKRLLTDAQLDDFFKEMKSKPLIEQRFFVYKGEEEVPPLTSQEHIPITESITRNTGMNVLFRCNNSLRMVPSFSMMQSYLNKKSGEHAVQINPVIAMSSVKDIENNGLMKKRDLALSVQGLTLPETADAFKAVGPDFFLHDFYHAMTCSSSPAEHRVFFIRIASIIGDFLPSLPEKEQRATRKFLDRIIDLELGVYLSHLLTTGEVATSSDFLWKSVELFIKGHFLVELEHISEETKNKIFSAVRDGLSREDLLLMGLPNRLFRAQEKEITGILVRNMKVSPEQVNELIQKYYKDLDNFTRYELINTRGGLDLRIGRSLTEAERVGFDDHVLTQFGLTFWENIVKDPGLALTITGAFNAIRRSQIRSIIESGSWSREKDPIDAQMRASLEERPLPPLIIDIKDLNAKLNSIRDNFQAAPKVSKEAYLEYIKEEKNKFDAAIMQAFPDNLQGFLLLTKFYESMEMTLILVRNAPDSAGNPKSTVPELIKMISSTVWGVLSGDSDLTNTITLLFSDYYSLLEDIDTIEFSTAKASSPVVSLKAEGSLEIDDYAELKTGITDFIEKYSVTKKYDKLFIASINHVIETKKQLLKQGNIAAESLSNPARGSAPLAFTEMTRRIAPEKFEQLQKALDSKPRVSRSFLQAIEDGDLKKITQVKDYSSEALKALRAGLISKETFATIHMYRTTIECAGSENVEILRVFVDGRVNPKARVLINETLILRKSFNYEEGRLFPRENVSLLTSEQLDDFFKEMESKPLIEQQFFVYKGEEDPSLLAPPEDLSFIQMVGRSSGLNVLFRCNNSLRMVPSFTMMQTYLNTKYGEGAIQINPVVALSSLSDVMNNGLMQKRDMALSVPGITLPETRSAFKVAGPDFLFHDFYYAMSGSSAPMEHRVLFIKVASVIEGFLPSLSEKEQKSTRKLLGRILNLELGVHFRYLLSTGQIGTSNDFLWETIELFIKTHCTMDLDHISEETKNRIFSAVRDGLSREDLLLLGLPNKLFKAKEKELTDLLIRHSGSSQKEVEGWISEYYEAIESPEYLYQSNQALREVETRLERDLTRVERIQVDTHLLTMLGQQFWLSKLLNSERSINESNSDFVDSESKYLERTSKYVSVAMAIAASFNFIKQSSLHSIIQSKSWEREEDSLSSYESAAQVETTNTVFPKLLRVDDLKAKLLSIIINLDIWPETSKEEALLSMRESFIRGKTEGSNLFLVENMEEALSIARGSEGAPTKSKEAYLQFIKAEKDKFDKAIIEAFADPLQGSLILGKFYEALDTSIVMMSLMAPGVSVPSIQDLDNCIEGVASACLLSTGDSELIKIVVALFSQYYSLLKDVDYMEFPRVS